MGSACNNRWLQSLFFQTGDADLKVTWFGSDSWICLLVNKLIFPKVTICFGALFPPFCFLPPSFLYLPHPLSVTREEAVMSLRGRYETWLVKADKRRLLHISILRRTATAWLRLYGLLLYSCLRTGIGTCSRMPIRQPWLIQLALAGALPAASPRLCCRLVCLQRNF